MNVFEIFNYLCCTNYFSTTDTDTEDTIIEHIIYFPQFNNKPLEDQTKVNIKYTTINGLLDGHHLLYDRNGLLLSSSYYKRGKLDGETIHYNIFVKNTDGGTDEFKKIKKYIQSFSNDFQSIEGYI